MSSYIDLKFINDLSSRLSQFKRKTEHLFNFRCPYCGDSEKNKTKARGYLYRKKNDMFYKCHNCGVGASLGNFIKHLDPKMYSEYVLERYKGSAPTTQKPKFDFKPSKFKDYTILDDLKKISDLPEDHPVFKYVKNRLIPPAYYDKLYLADKFHKFANKVKPNTFKERYDHPRLIIPFFDVDGKVFAFQGRAFGKEQPKYITLKFDEDKQKVFGLDRVNLQQHIHIVEGPIDSFFIDNCIAAAGADLTINISPDNITYIFDNEPRNKEIIKRMETIIDKGYNVVIWPDSIQSKDVNEMLMTKEISLQQLPSLISTNPYSRLSALTQLNNYKKC